MEKIIIRNTIFVGLFLVFIGMFVIIIPGENMSIVANNEINIDILSKNNHAAIQEEWNKTFGGTTFDVGLTGEQASDGGFIIGGIKDANWWDSGGDGWVIKTDGNGDEEWNKTFGGTGTDKCGDISVTSDNGYIFTGGTTSFGSGNMDVWLTKIDINGNEEWNKTYGGTDDDQGVSVQQTDDGGYIIAGSTRSIGHGGSDGWLIKTDGNGDEEWNKTFGDSVGGEYLMSVQQTDDGGYIATGRNYLDNGWTSSNVIIIRTDRRGDIQWEKSFGGSYLDSCLCIQQADDGGYILTGQSQIYSSDEEEDFSLIKLDNNGNIEWSRYFGERETFDSGTSVKQTSDGGYIATGFISNDAVLIKTDSSGNTEWSRTFGGSDQDEGFEIQQTADEGYIIVGFTESYGSGNKDVWLIKIAAFENSRPNKPITPSGPLEGNIGKEYVYTSSGTDSEGDQIYYKFDWSDGTTSKWSGPYKSGEECSESHIWYGKGNYEIKIKTMDEHGGESDWSDPLIISMPKNRITENYRSYQLFYRFMNILMNSNHVKSSYLSLIFSNMKFRGYE